MVDHCWGDDWFKEHERSLRRAMTFIQTECAKHKNMQIYCKEKYGTVRWEFVYVWFLSPYHGLVYQLMRPGYLHIQYCKNKTLNKWLNRLDTGLMKLACLTGYVHYTNKSRLNYFLNTVERACMHWPEVAPEIVDTLDEDFDHPRIQEIQNKWGRVCRTLNTLTETH